MTKNVTKEKVAKALLMILIIICAITIFPKNLKVAFEDYDVSNKKIEITDPASGQTEEAWYIFNQGYYFLSPITKALPEKLEVTSDYANSEAVSIYYGSVKIGTGVPANIDGKWSANLTYRSGLLAGLISFYIVLSIILAAAGILFVYKAEIKVPSVRSLGVGFKDLCAVAAVTVLFSVLAFFIGRIPLNRNIYPIEICFAAVMFFLTIIVMKAYTGELKSSLVLSPAVYTAIYMSVNKIIAFTFVDGNQAITEQTLIMSDRLRHWEKNSARLNYILMGTFERYNIIGKLEGETAAKLVHWAFGMVFFIILTYLICTRLLESGNAKEKTVNFLVSFLGIFSFNYTYTALKNYNYDLFSLTFGAIAFVYFLSAVRNRKKSEAVLALAWATFGALEKMLVWPFMLLAMLAYVILFALEREKSGATKNRIYLLAASDTIKLGMFTLAISMASNLYIQHVVRSDVFPRYGLSNLFRPTQGQMHTLLSVVLPGTSADLRSILGNFLSWIMVYCGFVLFYFLGRKLSAASDATKEKAYIILRIYTAFTALLLAVGIVFTYFKTPDSASAKAGVFENIAEALSSYANSHTTVAMLLILASLLFWKKGEKHLEYLLFTGLFSVYIPAAYVFIDRTNGRYFNLFGMCSLICVYVMLRAKLKSTYVKEIAAVLVMFTLCAAELLSFAPAQFNFFPVWNFANYGKGGVYSAGCERIEAGEYLLSYYNKNGLDSSHIEVYADYGGDWNAMPEGWTMRIIPTESRESLGDTKLTDIVFGDDVYYMFTYRAISTKRYPFYPLPSEDIKPFFTVTRRGTIEAWVYKSEDLRGYFEEVFKER